MTTTVLEREPVTATDAEQPVLNRIEHLLEGEAEGTARLIGPSGESIELPRTLYDILRQVVHHLTHEQAVSIVPVGKELTTQQAADLLNVSRPYLIRLLERDEIPYRRVGTHRRIQFGDLMAYKHQRDQERRSGLRQLTRMSQQLGLYKKTSKR